MPDGPRRPASNDWKTRGLIMANKRDWETMPGEHGPRRRIQFTNMKLSATDKEKIKAALCVPDDAAAFACKLIENAFRVYRESDMNPEFKMDARVSIEAKTEALRAALSAVMDCPATLQALDWVYCCEGGKGWTGADLPACKMPDLRQAVADLRGKPVSNNPSRFEFISIMEMMQRIFKTCELSSNPVEVAEQLGRDPDGKLIATKTKTYKTAAAATVTRGKGNPGLSWGEVAFTEYMAGIYDACGGKFTRQQHKGFDRFLRCVFKALDPDYSDEANHDALLKAVAAKRKPATLKPRKKQQ
jgi:hypothetical protein